MTVLLGIVCTDGVVVGCDSSATFGTGRLSTIEQPINKLSIVDGCVVLMGTGAVGLNQRFEAVVTAYCKENPGIGSRDQLGIVKTLATKGLSDFKSTFCPPGGYGALLAFPSKQGHVLCEFAVADFQPELKQGPSWFGNMGGGQPIADPIMALMREVFWQGTQPNLSVGTLALTWALDHVIQVNVGGVGGKAHLAQLKMEGSSYLARKIEDEELEEHRQFIEEIKTRMRGFWTRESSVAPPPTA